MGVVTVKKEIPALLTVEEAGRLLRIGRTKAYAMATEWRETGGRSGLPVVDLGHVLRVPRRALEELIGAELNDDTDGDRDQETETAPPARPPRPASTSSTERTPPQPSSTTRRNRRRQHRIQNQLDLFNPKPESS